VIFSIKQKFLKCSGLLGWVWSAFFYGSLAFAQAAPPAEWQYSARRGDSLSSIERLFLKQPGQGMKLATYNQIKFPNVLAIGQVLRIPTEWLRQEPGPVILESKSGLVTVQLSESSPVEPAQTGVALSSGMLLRTGSQSSGVLKFADGSLLTLQPLSNLTLDTVVVYAGGSMADSRVRLTEGRMQVKANPFQRIGQRFEVLTPSAVVAVRGTEFWLQATEERTLQQTLEGRVRIIANQAEVDVPQGFGNVVNLGSPPSELIRLQSAPEIRRLPERFTQLPVAFTLPSDQSGPRWYAQVLLDTPTEELVRELSVSSPLLDWVSLPNGLYKLRVQAMADSGLPGLPALHRFEVAVPRTKVGAALPIQGRAFQAGPLQVQLPRLGPDQAYLVQLAEDAQGERVVWQQLSDQADLQIPVPDAAATAVLYFLAWRYSKTSP
jgi:hypothetical protein